MSEQEITAERAERLIREMMAGVGGSWEVLVRETAWVGTAGMIAGLVVAGFAVLAFWRVMAVTMKPQDDLGPVFFLLAVIVSVGFIACIFAMWSASGALAPNKTLLLELMEKF